MRRRLKPEEVELWRRVAKTTERLNPERREDHGLLAKPAAQKAARPLLQEFEIGQKKAGTKPEHDVSPDIAERIARQPVKMDQKTYGKLKRGKVVPEARLDLHGMTMDQAHPARPCAGQAAGASHHRQGQDPRRGRPDPGQARGAAP